MLATAAAIRCTVVAWQSGANKTPAQLGWASDAERARRETAFSPEPSDQADDEEQSSSH